jgi:hypothetical protein
MKTLKQKKIPKRTMQERRDRAKAYAQLWRMQNKNVYEKCECGVDVAKTYRGVHIKTKKHFKRMIIPELDPEMTETSSQVNI